MTAVQSVVGIEIDESSRKLFVLEADVEHLLMEEGFVFVGNGEYEKRLSDGTVIGAWVTSEQPQADALRHILREVECSLKKVA